MPEKSPNFIFQLLDTPFFENVPAATASIIVAIIGAIATIIGAIASIVVNIPTSRQAGAEKKEGDSAEKSSSPVGAWGIVIFMGGVILFVLGATFFSLWHVSVTTDPNSITEEMENALNREVSKWDQEIAILNEKVDELSDKNRNIEETLIELAILNEKVDELSDKNRNIEETLIELATKTEVISLSLSTKIKSTELSPGQIVEDTTKSSSDLVSNLDFQEMENALNREVSKQDQEIAVLNEKVDVLNSKIQSIEKTLTELVTRTEVVSLPLNSNIDSTGLSSNQLVEDTKESSSDLAGNLNFQGSSSGDGLFGSTVLEVAIGLFFVYLLMSIVCSSLNETVALFLKLRAKHLQYGIDNLLCDPILADKVLNHPLIKSMGNTRAEISLVQKLAELSLGRAKAGLPSYVPASTFALALFDGLVPTKDEPLTVERLRHEVLGMANEVDPQKEGRRSIGTALLQLIDASKDPQKVLLQAETVKQMVKNLSSPDNEKLTTEIKEAETVEEIRRMVLNFPEGDTRQAILNFIEAGQIELAAVRKNIEGWFDNAMERVGGVYKRYVQTLLLFFALAITLLLGVDTLQIIDNLTNNSILREAVVAEASQVEEANQEAGESSSNGDSALDRLTELGLPIGYNEAPAFLSQEWWSWFVRKIPGLLLTTFAVSLGAPFWFDVLQKVSNLRAAGKPPKKSDEDTTSEVKK